MYLCAIWNITKRQTYDGNEAFNPDIFGDHHDRDVSGVRHRQMEGAAQPVAHPRKRAIGVGGSWRQRRGVVGDAGLASQDPAQEVQVRRAGDIRGAGGAGIVVAVGELSELGELCVIFTAPVLAKPLRDAQMCETSQIFRTNPVIHQLTKHTASSSSTFGSSENAGKDTPTEAVCVGISHCGCDSTSTMPMAPVTMPEMNTATIIRR